MIGNVSLFTARVVPLDKLNPREMLNISYCNVGKSVIEKAEIDFGSSDQSENIIVLFVSIDLNYIEHTSIQFIFVRKVEGWQIHGLP